jgi:hypothetical protein
VRALAAHGHPVPGRVTGQSAGGQDVGDLGQRGTVAVPAVGVDRVRTGPSRDRGDRRPP